MKKTEIKCNGKQLVVIEKNRSECIDYCNIIAIHYAEPYLYIRRFYDNEYLIIYSLKELIKFLPESFIFCNKATIVYLIHVNSLKSQGSHYFLQLSEKDTISRRKFKM